MVKLIPTPSTWRHDDLLSFHEAILPRRRRFHRFLTFLAWSLWCGRGCDGTGLGPLAQKVFRFLPWQWYDRMQFGIWEWYTFLMAGGTKESRKVVVMPLNLLKMLQEVFWSETNLTIVSYGRYDRWMNGFCMPDQLARVLRVDSFTDGENALWHLLLFPSLFFCSSSSHSFFFALSFVVVASHWQSIAL